MIAKSHLYTAVWQVKLKTVSSNMLSSDDRKKRYSPWALNWITSFLNTDNLFLNFQPPAPCQALGRNSKIFDG
jgi:hypothetical protein